MIAFDGPVDGLLQAAARLVYYPHWHPSRDGWSFVAGDVGSWCRYRVYPAENWVLTPGYRDPSRGFFSWQRQPYVVCMVGPTYSRARRYRFRFSEALISEQEYSSPTFVVRDRHGSGRGPESESYPVLASAGSPPVPGLLWFGPPEIGRKGGRFEFTIRFGAGVSVPVWPERSGFRLPG